MVKRGRLVVSIPQLGLGAFAAMHTVSAISWKRAAGLACLLVYGPFIVMATYALVFESSSYCKTHAWTLLPFGPGLLPVEAGRRWFELPRPSDALGFALAFIVSFIVVCLLASLVRRKRWVRFASMAVALAAFSLSAVSMLAMLRS